ncbi:hypothetical protein JCM31826_14900 [Thermaurantimonas aggregans]|uniref:HNH endonuclease n=1 Tax=Thermaurantimonas aggregans TaxID=2173829 RepID=A0A401XLZ1_9FLAO|nr:hypothetical protein [Thermaurantimonas aggregans]MCX8149515.1 hypothetical protein [Thermaurantimonas aggregans]GCD78008.1 hypothetical protein JCM31826_14900 [Thermaurantimonas aggregans]
MNTKNMNNTSETFKNGAYGANNAFAEQGRPMYAEEATHGSYGALLLHPEWKKCRERILARDFRKCRNCGSPDELEVHHRQYHFYLSQNKYAEPWNYPDHLMITLCKRCHARGHQLFQVPTFYVE